MKEVKRQRTMMAGSKPMAKRIFSGHVSMSLLRRMATTPFLQRAAKDQDCLGTGAQRLPGMKA